MSSNGDLAINSKRNLCALTVKGLENFHFEIVSCFGLSSLEGYLLCYKMKYNGKRGSYTFLGC